MIGEIEQNDIKYLRDRIIRWGRNNYTEFPWRSVQNRWHALVAEIMLQRTRADQVVPVFFEFCRKYTTPVDYLADNRANIFQSLGLIWREAILKRLASALAASGEPPSEKDALLNLPGIGDYIAGAYRSFHLDIRDTIIDSNIVRIYGRFFDFETDPETRRKKWLIELSERITPKRTFKDYNYGLIDFTRTICQPKPLCRGCVLNKRCQYYAGLSPIERKNA